MDSGVLLTEQIDPATTLLTLNRPARRNALTIELMQSICHELDDLARGPGQRIAILQGAGPAFCSGLDLDEASNPDLTEHSSNWIAHLFETITRSPLITIAAAHGAAYAGGAGLLACCDFSVAAIDLTLAFPEVRRGLLPALVAALLRDRVRTADAHELFLAAEPVTATRAQSMGLIHRVVPASQVLEEARQLASTVLKGAPDAVRQTKRLLRELRATDLSEQLAHALKFHKQARVSDEAQEGLAAFREHRPPVWPVSDSPST
jgi:methylglutaconyl-CoA hydratase